MARRNRSLSPKIPLLITESAEEFDCLRNAFEQLVKPKDVVEQIYMDDVVDLSWEIIRLRRCKAAMINTAFCGALSNILMQILPRGLDVKEKAINLAHRWFTDPEGKKEVSKLLKQYYLDESALEAEAVRRLSEDLGRLDKILESLEWRRNKTLRNIAKHHESFARRLRDSSEQIIKGKALSLEHLPESETPAAA